MSMDAWQKLSRGADGSITPDQQLSSDVALAGT